jgi:hypothetical protein
VKDTSPIPAGAVLAHIWAAANSVRPRKKERTNADTKVRPMKIRIATLINDAGARKEATKVIWGN